MAKYITFIRGILLSLLSSRAFPNMSWNGLARVWPPVPLVSQKEATLERFLLRGGGEGPPPKWSVSSWPDFVSSSVQIALNLLSVTIRLPARSMCLH